MRRCKLIGPHRMCGLKGDDVIMFGTVIIDAYKANEANQIAEALDDLCNPTDNHGWASAGVYSFWNYYTKELYYIGYTADLYERFLNHNGMFPVDDGCSKKNNIDGYFKKYNKLGYSIFVQSPLAQPIVYRNREKYKGYRIKDEGLENIKIVEGALIEAYRKVHGGLLAWNKVGGSIDGQITSELGNYSIIKSFTDLGSNPLVSRYSLRELLDNPTFVRYESFLHGARMLMLSEGFSFNEALNVKKEFSIIDTYAEMVNAGYFNKKLVV